MSDTFPELELALPEAQLEALGALAASGAGEKLVNTLCLAAACGNAPLARFVLAECARPPAHCPSQPPAERVVAQVRPVAAGRGGSSYSYIIVQRKL